MSNEKIMVRLMVREIQYIHCYMYVQFAQITFHLTLKKKSPEERFVLFFNVMVYYNMTLKLKCSLLLYTLFSLYSSNPARTGQAEF